MNLRSAAPALLALWLSAPAIADERPRSDWPFCPVPPEEIRVPPRPVVEDALEPGDVHVLADEADLSEDDVSHLFGNVQMTRDRQQVTADEAHYYKQPDNADFSGNVRYWDDGIYLEGDTAHLEFDDGTGSLSNARYRLVGQRGWGSARELFMDYGDITRGINATFTTCDPEREGFDTDSNFWSISAGRVTLDHVNERGSARNVVLRIKDVPVFWTPYLSFPLSDKRKSGFLTPSFGSSSRSGFETRTPYYWNIAPNMDATFTPRVLSDRGVMAMGQYRYLFRRAHGELNVAYLPDDDRHGGEDRSSIGFLHEQRFRRGSLYLTYNRVSDRNFIEDFSGDLNRSSGRFLDRRADLRYRYGWMSVLARVQDFQPIDESVPLDSEPYRRLPHVRISAAPITGRNRLNFTVHADLAYFDRDKDHLFVSNVEGFRADLYPAISYRYETPGTFLTPRIGVHFTQYDLTDTGPFPDSPSRILPVASLDGGAFLERELRLAGTEFLQTLEPRFYYLYVPDDDQEDIPVFDTSVYALSFPLLFREDRFSGLDRIGDANRLSLAVTSRFINRGTGAELGFVRAGQFIYFEDQDVIRRRVLSNGRVVGDGRTHEAGFGPVLAEFGLNLTEDWKFRGEIHIQPEDGTTERMAARVQYLPGDGRVLNLAYRVRRAATGEIRRNPLDIDQTDVSFRWPLNPKWSVVGRWNYAIPENRSLEMFAGIEYESCCWGLRAVARRYLSNLDGDFSTGIFLELELKGLAGLGMDAVGFLEESIRGYEPEF